MLKISCNQNQFFCQSSGGFFGFFWLKAKYLLLFIILCQLICMKFGMKVKCTGKKYSKVIFMSLPVMKNNYNVNYNIRKSQRQRIHNPRQY